MSAWDSRDERCSDVGSLEKILRFAQDDTEEWYRIYATPRCTILKSFWTLRMERVTGPDNCVGKMQFQNRGPRKTR